MCECCAARSGGSVAAVYGLVGLSTAGPANGSSFSRYQCEFGGRDSLDQPSIPLFLPPFLRFSFAPREAPVLSNSRHLGTDANSVRPYFGSDSEELRDSGFLIRPRYPWWSPTNECGLEGEGEFDGELIPEILSGLNDRT